MVLIKVIKFRYFRAPLLSVALRRCLSVLIMSTKALNDALFVVEDENVLFDVDQFLHDHILTLADELAFRFDGRL